MEAKALVFLESNQALTDSRTVAEQFGKNHRHVLEAIREILAAENSAAKFFHESTFDSCALIQQAGGMPKIGETPLFAETTYIHEQNGQLFLHRLAYL